MDKKRVGIIVVILSILILVTTALLANNVRSESNIIGKMMDQLIFGSPLKQTKCFL